MNRQERNLHTKYPQTPHLPWSGALILNQQHNDDLIMSDPDTCFGGKEVVVTCKLDGENTTIYADGIHARSLNSGRHESRSYVKSLWANRLRYIIPEGWRICGENLYAEHSIHYDNLLDYFLVFSIWNEQNICLSWDETLEWCNYFGLIPVQEFYRGIYTTGKAIDRKVRGSCNAHLDKGMCNCIISQQKDDVEGYVIRITDQFSFSDFEKSVAKFVRTNHVQTDNHWFKHLRRNRIIR